MLLEVGKLYKEGIYKYQEGIRFDFTNAGADLYIMYNSPTTKEIESIRRGNIEFGIYPSEEVLFMLFKFGNLQWMDAPYSVHLSNQLELQEPKDGLGYSLNVVLINASNGIVEVIRLIGLSTKFSIQLKKLIERQRERHFDRDQYALKLQEIYRNYKTSDLVQRTILTYRHRSE